MSPSLTGQPRAVPSPRSLPLSCLEKSRAEENQLLPEGWRLSTAHECPSPAIPNNGFEITTTQPIAPSCGFHVPGAHQPPHGTEEKHLGAASEANSFSEGPFSLAAICVTALSKGLLS